MKKNIRITDDLFGNKFVTDESGKYVGMVSDLLVGSIFTSADNKTQATIMPDLIGETATIDQETDDFPF